MEATRNTIPPVQRAIAVATSLFAVIGGLVTLAGWYLDIPRLTDWANDGISMFANPAMSVVLLGFATQILVATKNIIAVSVSRALSIFVAALALLTLVEHLSGVSLEIDTLLVTREWGQNASLSQMRMGKPACLSFFLLGFAIALTSGGSYQRRIACLSFCLLSPFPVCR